MKLNALTSFFASPRKPRPQGVAFSTSEPRDGVSLTAPKSLEAPPSSNPEVQVLGRFPSSRWSWTELLFDKDPHFTQANFGPRGNQRDPEIVAAFGSDKPHSGNVLLHYAGPPPAGVKKQPYPVVLVHGANKSGSFWYEESKQPLPDKLRAEGFDVYFVSFAHPHDDNFVWAEQMANCIERVKQLSGKDKVDLVAHSKGGSPARAYVSDMRQDWMTPYRGDVHRLVLAGAANGGLDTTFRHASSNLALLGQSDSPLLNAPTSWESTRFMGVVPIDIRERSYSNEKGDCWPGQDQLLARWDSKYPIAYWEQDSYTTYHGGEGFVSTSKGIDHYIRQGGNYIQHLNEAKIDPAVEVALLAGDNPNIPGVVNENTGPSDGLLFVDSALHMPSTSNVKAKAVLHLNHKALVNDAEGQQWITDTLKLA